MEALAVMFLLALAIALLVNYAHGGWPQVGAWLKAKYVGS